MLTQVFSLIGAFMILWAYVGLNYKWFDAESKKYHWINFLGSGFLLYSAVVNFQIGFIVLQTVWGGISGKKLLSGTLH